MAIRGNLNEASLPDVLQLLAMGSKSGCLTLASDKGFGSIYFDNGRISYATVGGRGLATADAVYAMFAWTVGTFSFEPGVTPSKDAVLVAVDPQELLLEGARRVDEWSLIEKKIPSLDVVFALDRQQMLRNSIAFSIEQQMLLPLIDGHRDVKELMKESGLGEFGVGKALYGLMSGGFLVPVGRREPDPVIADSVIAEHRNLGIAFYRARMYSDAAREFRRIIELRSTDATASFFLGLIAVRESRWNDAATAFQGSAATSPRSSAVLVNLAYAYERLGQYEKARLALEQVVNRATMPEPLAHLGLAALALHRRDVESASLALEHARQAWGGATPPAAWFHYAGLEAAMRGDVRGAAQLLVEGVQHYPAEPVLLNNLAVAQEMCGHFDDAREAAERAVNTDCAMPQLYRNLGDALRRAGRPEEAQAAYLRAEAVHAGAVAG
jgi:tetratricopeptide (TPR) repeat protein